MLDLGAGTGNNTLYLTEKGLKVIATDYSEVALNIIENNINSIFPQFRRFSCWEHLYHILVV